jgi:hypothetical protein
MVAIKQKEKENPRRVGLPRVQYALMLSGMHPKIKS